MIFFFQILLDSDQGQSSGSEEVVRNVVWFIEIDIGKTATTKTQTKQQQQKFASVLSLMNLNNKSSHNHVLSFWTKVFEILATMMSDNLWVWPSLCLHLPCPWIELCTIFSWVGKRKINGIQCIRILVLIDIVWKTYLVCQHGRHTCYIVPKSADQLEQWYPLSPPQTHTHTCIHMW